MRCKRYLIGWSLFFAMYLSSIGQDTIVLQSVEVTASVIRHEHETTMERKIDTAIIQRLNTVSLSQLLIQYSPVFIKTYGPGGIASASFRGTTASHTLVLWNGFQLNAPSLGQVDFSTIPVFMTDEIDLQWGSRTSANSGGLGGVVNINNNKCFNKGLIVDFKQTYGSFNTIGTYLTAGYSGRHCMTRVKVYRSSSDNDFKYNNIALIPHQTMKQKNGKFLDNGVMPEFQYQFKKSLLSLASWNQWSHRNHPQIMPNVFNDHTKEYSDNRFSRNYISYKTYWNTGSVEMKSAYFYEEQHYFLETYASNGNPVTQINSANDADVFHQILDLKQNLYKSWKFYSKIQWDHEKVVSNNYDETKLRDIVSFYVAINGNPLKNIDLRLTLRNDIVDIESVGFFPTATLSYHTPFLKGLSISAGYSHNYRTPSFNDLYWYPGGNKNLKPENGKTIDFNVKYLLNQDYFHLDIQMGAYVSKVKDWIQWVPTCYRYWTPENLSDVLAKGFEIHFNGNYKYHFWDFSLSGNYVYSHTTDESKYAEQNDIENKQLIYIPLHHANLFAEVKWKTWDITYTAEFTGERKTSMNDDEFFAYKLQPYILQHITLGKQIKKFRLELRINNLTVEDYQTVLWRAMPGRSYEIFFGYKI